MVSLLERLFERLAFDFFREKARVSTDFDAIRKNKQRDYEILQKRASGHAEAAGGEEQPAEASSGGILGQLGGMLGSVLGGGDSGGKGKRQRMSTGEMIVRSAAQSAARSVGTQITRAILRGVLGGLSR